MDSQVVFWWVLLSALGLFVLAIIIRWIADLMKESSMRVGLHPMALVATNYEPPPPSAAYAGIAAALAGAVLWTIGIATGFPALFLVALRGAIVGYISGMCHAVPLLGGLLARIIPIGETLRMVASTAAVLISAVMGAASVACLAG